MDSLSQISDYSRSCYRGMRGHIQRMRSKIARWQQEQLLERYALPSISIDDIVPPITSQAAPITDGACMPPFYYRHHDDFGPLMRLVVHRAPKLVVELGTAHGNTVANICRVNRQCRVVTVNAPPELQTGTLTTYEVTRDEIGRVYRNHGYADRVTQVFENTLSLDLAHFVEKGTVDLAVIDACHDQDYVINDFMKCLPFLANDGLILLHDTHPSMVEHLKGSYQACVVLRKQGFDIRHVVDTWWGIFSPIGLLATCGK